MFENTWACVSKVLNLETYHYYQSSAAKKWALANKLDVILGNVNSTVVQQITVQDFYDPSGLGESCLVGLNNDRWHLKNFSSTYFDREGDNNKQLDPTALAKVLSANAKIARFSSRKEFILSYIMPVIEICALPILLSVSFATDLINSAVILFLTLAHQAKGLYHLYRRADDADSNQSGDTALETTEALNNDNSAPVQQAQPQQYFTPGLDAARTNDNGFGIDATSSSAWAGPRFNDFGLEI